MKVTRTLGRTATAGLVGAIALAGLGTSAYAASSSPSSTGSSSSASSPSSAISTTAGRSSAAGTASGGKLRSLLARADEATIELKVKGNWVVYDIDRGKVSAVSASSITLALPDGKSVTDTITSATTFEGVASESAVTVGHRAMVTSTNGAALRIRQGR